MSTPHFNKRFSAESRSTKREDSSRFIASPAVPWDRSGGVFVVLQTESWLDTGCRKNFENTFPLGVLCRGIKLVSLHVPFLWNETEQLWKYNRWCVISGALLWGYKNRFVKIHLWDLFLEVKTTYLFTFLNHQLPKSYQHLIRFLSIILMSPKGINFMKCGTCLC